MLVKVLAVEGNRIRLSRKAILKEQRAKMGGAPPSEGGEGGGGHEERAPAESVAVGAPVAGAALTLEGGADFEEGDEPNFNRVESASQPPSQAPRADGDRGGRGGRPGGGGGGGRHRRRDGGRGGRGGHGGGGGGGRR